MSGDELDVATLPVETMPVAVLGLGLMGGAMMRRLLETGHAVAGYDPSPAAGAAAAEAGARVASSVAGAVDGAGAVFTSLPDSPAVREVWTGDGGIIGNAGPGTFVLELSTIDPDTMRDVAAAAVAAGLRPIDCPVSGGPVEARAGTLALIVGGAEADVEAATPLLAQLGSVARTGPAGTAKVVKLCNNMMSMGNVAVAAEAFALGEAAGVDPDTLYEVLSTSGGRSHHFLKRFPQALADNWAPGFTVALGEKDLRLAIELGRTLALPTPTAEAARQRYRGAIDAGMGLEDIVSLLRLYRSQLGSTSTGDRGDAAR